jgi:hypothetical protein
MNRLTDSTNRGPRDYFYFGAVFLGILLATSGMIVTSPRFTLLGAFVLVLGLAYFLIRN